jgi:hypothetical protein
MLVLRVRRYRCRGCRAVCTVVPRGVVRRRHFGAGAIGWALFLYGHEHLSARAVRAHVGGFGSPDAGDWVTLRRWLAAVAQGGLFRVRRSPEDFTARQTAERAAMTLASFAPPAASRGIAGRAGVHRRRDPRAGCVMASRTIRAVQQAPPRWSADEKEDT